MLVWLTDPATGRSRNGSGACGGSRPRYPNDSTENQALNNRVEIFLDLGSDPARIRGVLEQYGEKIDPDTREFVPVK